MRRGTFRPADLLVLAFLLLALVSLAYARFSREERVTATVTDRAGCAVVQPADADSVRLLPRECTDQADR